MTVCVTKQYRTETAHRLREYRGLCRHLHGHSYLWEVTAESETGLDSLGIAVDFKDLKAAMVEVLEPWDHATLLREDDPLLQGGVLDDDENRAPGRVHVFETNPTAEHLAAVAGERIQAMLPAGVRLTEVRCWETSTSFATWRPDASGADK